MTQHPELRAQAVEALVALGQGQDSAESLAAGWDEATLRQVVDAGAEIARERDELRDRLRADADLRKVVCPPADWKDPYDRFDLARRAVKLLAASAEANKVPVDVLVREMAAHDLTVADGIRLHSTPAEVYDPRHTEWGKDFYAFRWRIRDGVGYAKADEKAAAWARWVAEVEARGEKVCDRCGGQGGANHWPGFTCYECGGRKTLPADHK